MSRPYYMLLILCCALILAGVNAPARHSSWAYGSYQHSEVSSDVSTTTTSLEMRFVGDIMLGRVVEQYMKGYSSDYPFRHLTTPSSTVLIGNLEGVIPRDHKPTPPYGLVFSFPTSSVTALEEAGYDYLSLANNHAYDLGYEEYEYTKSILASAGIVPVGDVSIDAAVSRTKIPHDTHSVILIAINAFDETPSSTALDRLFSDISNEDLVVVYIHWGEEYELVHTAAQRRLADALAARGTDLIVGHHPHVVQPIEKIGDTLVLYSLGNFIFDQYFDEEVQIGLVADLMLNAGERSLSLVPVTTIGSPSSPRPMTTYEQTTFLSALSERSDQSLRDDILSGTIQW